MSKSIIIFPLISFFKKSKVTKEIAILEAIIIIPSITALIGYCLGLSATPDWLSLAIPMFIGILLISIYVKYITETYGHLEQ